MNYRLDYSGSDGNCVLIDDDTIMVDIGNGVPFSYIVHFLCTVRIIWITHIHSDHLNIAHVKKIMVEYPEILIVGNEHVAEFIYEKTGLKIETIYLGEELEYDNGFGKTHTIKPVNLYHDVTNYGFLLNVVDSVLETEELLFFGVDTNVTEGIKIPLCDCILLECNHDLEYLLEVSKRLKDSGAYDYTLRSRMSHLNSHQWKEFVSTFLKNGGVAEKLHMSKKTFKEDNGNLEIY